MKFLSLNIFLAQTNLHFDASNSDQDFFSVYSHDKSYFQQGCWKIGFSSRTIPSCESTMAPLREKSKKSIVSLLSKNVVDLHKCAVHRAITK